MSNHRYVTRAGSGPAAPRASYYDGGLGLIHMPDSVTVVEQDKAPQATGLFDASGCPLYRVEEQVRIGFHTR